MSRGFLIWKLAGCCSRFSGKWKLGQKCAWEVKFGKLSRGWSVLGLGRRDSMKDHGAEVDRQGQRGQNCHVLLSGHEVGFRKGFTRELTEGKAGNRPQSKEQL